MLHLSEIPIKWLYISGITVFFITAWFSAGYNQFDEHFQVLEFAGLKLGLTEKANLPWEYACKMRPALQPLIVCCIYKTISFLGTTDPFYITFFIRLFSAAVSLLSIHLAVRLYSAEFTNIKLLHAFLLLSFFLWFVPYNSARFASETFGGRVFLIGLAWFFLQRKIKPVDYFITGIILGIAFVIRYQIAFMVIGFAFWLIIIRKTRFLDLLLFSSGIILFTLIGVLIDRWYYEEWVITTWNYFLQNILLGKASGFGISPWWYYIEQTFMNAIPPFSLLLILAVFLYFYYFPKDILTWVFVPFLAVHFLIPHKEIRFIFPIIGFLPYMMIKVADFILKKKRYDLLETKLIKIPVTIFWYVNLLMLLILCFRPADAQISLYKKLWYDFQQPAVLYYTDDNPYYRAKAHVCFYKRDHLVLRKVDSLQTIVPPADTACLVLTNNRDLTMAGQYDLFPVYSSLPAFVRRYDINHWTDRTYFWYIYQVKQKPNLIHH